MSAQQQVDEVTRSILYPWVREALEQLAIMRDDCARELAYINLPSPNLKSIGFKDSVRHVRLKQHINRIDQILAQAFPLAMEKNP